MKLRFFKLSVIFTVLIVLIVLQFGCFISYDGTIIDGIYVRYNNFSVSKEDEEKSIAPIVKVVKDNLEGSLVLYKVSMATPTGIDFSFSNLNTNDSLEANITEMVKQIQVIHDKVVETMSSHVEDYDFINGVDFYLSCSGIYHDEPALLIRVGLNKETGIFYNSLYIYNSCALNSIKELKGNYIHLNNSTGEHLPQNWYDNFASILDLTTYISTNEDLQCISKLSNLKYADLVIKNNVDLSYLAGCKSIENLDLYLLNNVELSLFPELNNLKNLFIHSTNISNEDIQILKDKLPDCNVSLSDDMNVY